MNFKPVLFFSMTVTTSFSLKLISPLPPPVNSATDWYLSTSSSSPLPKGEFGSLVLLEVNRIYSKKMLN